MLVCKNYVTIKCHKLTINTLQMICTFQWVTLEKEKLVLANTFLLALEIQLQQAKHFHVEKNKTTLQVSDEYFIALVTCRVF